MHGEAICCAASQFNRLAAGVRSTCFLRKMAHQETKHARAILNRPSMHAGVGKVLVGCLLTGKVTLSAAGVTCPEASLADPKRRQASAVQDRA